MAAIGKRKANDVDHNGFHSDDRPMLKRRGTSASQIQIQHPSQDHHISVQITTSDQQQYGRNDSAMSSYDDNYSPKEEEHLQQNQQHHHQHQHQASLLPTPPPSTPLLQTEFPPQQPPPPQQPDTHPFLTLLTTFCKTHTTTPFGPAYLPTLQTSHSLATDPSSPPSLILASGKTFTRTLQAYIEDLQAAALSQVQLRAKMASVCVDSGVLEAVDAVLGKLDEQMMGVMAGMQGLEMELEVLEGEVQMQMRGREREAEMAML